MSTTSMQIQVNITHMQNHPRLCHAAAILQVGWISNQYTYWITMLIISSGNNYVLNVHEDLRYMADIQ